MKRPIAFALLAGLAATLASIVVYSALRKREAELQKAVANTVEIAVAARDLPLGTRIEPGAVKLVRWARDSLPVAAVTDPQSVMNNIVKDGFVENEPIVTTKLFTYQKGAGVLPLLIPVGMRAMSVAVDEVSDVAGFILPRARVDVVVSLAHTGEKSFSKVVLENMEVLAVAQQIEGKKEEPQVVKVVTLLVTPEQAERLALAGHEGSLSLALRSYTDDKIVLTSGSDDDSLVRAYSTNLPPVAQTQSQTARAHGAPSFGQAEVEIVRDGNRREIVSFVKGSRIRSTVGETPGPGQVEGKAAAARDAALAELPAGGLTPVEGSRTDAVGAIPKAVDVP